MFVSSIGVWDWQDTETHRIFHYFFILDLSLLILLINSSRTKMIKVILLLRCSTIWFQFVVAELSCVLLFATPWTAAPRLPCPPLSPWVCSNSCPLIQGCHPTISSCCPLLLLPSIFPSIRVFSSELALLIRWPKYWSFNISPSSEYSGLISFRVD